MIFIAIPSHDNVPVRFANDLAELYAFSCGALMGQVELHVLAGTYVHDARQQLATEAIESDASHVLWLDADMAFPRDALMRLLRHNVDMVGINYSTRSLPGRFVAKKNGGRVRTGPASAGLEAVDGIGFGVVLMRRVVLTRTLECGGAPLFRHEWNAERQQSIGEDYSFCPRAQAAGFTVFVDHDLSQDCGHVGAFLFRPEHATAGTS